MADNEATAVHTAPSTGVVNPGRCAGMNLASGNMTITAPKATTAPNADSSGVANPPLPATMGAALWYLDHRFQRLDENDTEQMLGRGGFGHALAGYDRLRQDKVVIKRQPVDTAAAARETAAYTMQDAFRHPNLLCTYGHGSVFHLLAEVHPASQIDNEPIEQARSRVNWNYAPL